jgi:hypothetical protein
MMTNLHTENQNFCCKRLVKLLSDPEMELRYYEVWRRFVLSGLIYNCPMCGQELPADLGDFYDEVLEKEFGMQPQEELQAEREGRFPQEFNSDEWWLKRQHYPNFPKKRLPRAELLKKVLYGDGFGSQAGRKAEYRKTLRRERAIKKQLGVICCTSFWENIHNEHKPNCEQHPNGGCSRSLIEYEPEKRRFLLKNIARIDQLLPNPRRRKRPLFYQFYYCPECGKQLPQSLANQWFQIVTKEFGVTDILNKKQLAKKLPPAFLTEEWWKTRNL